LVASGVGDVLSMPGVERTATAQLNVICLRGKTSKDETYARRLSPGFRQTRFLEDGNRGFL
jgi:hypothetical protein